MASLVKIYETLVERQRRALSIKTKERNLVGDLTLASVLNLPSVRALLFVYFLMHNSSNSQQHNLPVASRQTRLRFILVPC
jgi:hypothetical protein